MVSKQVKNTVAVWHFSISKKAHQPTITITEQLKVFTKCKIIIVRVVNFLSIFAKIGQSNLILVLNPGGRVGLVVRALPFHQCGPGSISTLGVIRGLSLLVLYSAMRGFGPGTPVFPSHQKPTFDLI